MIRPSAISLRVPFYALLLASAAFPVVAFAAKENAAVEADQASSAATDPGLTEIVVTATKRETDLQKTPISISVLGADDIQKRHVGSLLDLTDGGVPSLRVATFESRQSALTIGIRGIVPLDANQPAREQGVGVYLDGVYLGRQHGLNAGLLDIERIEVLKGPQGTLFGRNTEGGALSLVSRAPTGDFGGRVQVGAGNYGSYTGALHMDLPAVGNVAIKVDAALQHQGPTVENPLPGQAGWNQFHRYGGRVAARWTPSADFTADLAFDIGRDENTPFYSQLINYNPNNYPVATAAEIAAAGGKIPANRVAPLPPLLKVHTERQSVADIGVPQQPTIDKTQGFMATLRYHPTDNLELRSITAWRTVSDAQWDNSGGANRTPAFAPNASFSRYSMASLTQRQFSQELQMIGSLAQLDYVFGLYYFNEKASDWARTPNTNKWNADGTGYSIIDPSTYLSSAISRGSHAYAKSYAGYGQATYSPIEDVHVTVGARYTSDRKRGELYVVNGAPTNFTFKNTWNRFDPQVTLAFDATDNLHMYAKYATGYRAGGASSRSLTYRGFDPETVRSYEAGIKTEFLDRRVRFNLAGYMMDRNNSQVDFNFYIPQANGTIRNTLETVNAEGTTRIRGIEADLAVQPIDNLSLGLSYAYTYSKIPPTRNTVQEALNQSLNPANTAPVYQDVFIVFTPKNALSGTIDYSIPVGSGHAAIQIHLDGNYSDPMYTFDNEPVKSERSFVVNGRLSLADLSLGGWQRLTISAWARNLLNESHIYRRSDANSFPNPTNGAYNSVVGDYANFSAPRTFGLEGTIKF